MQIIGVIDLKDGTAVHARRGQRDTYAAVEQSAGAPVEGCALTLARHYVETFGLADLYLADLDAITSRAPQIEAIRRLTMLGASLQVDAGIVTPDDARQIIDAGADAIVVGLETLPSFDALADICSSSTRAVAFSLDLRNGTPLTTSDATAALSSEEMVRQAVAAGARSIIVLDVARVGAGGGPDLDMLRRILRAGPGVPVLAGGGVRGLDDLRQLAHVGCTGALVATALHEGQLRPADISYASTL